MWSRKQRCSQVGVTHSHTYRRPFSSSAHSAPSSRAFSPPQIHVCDSSALWHSGSCLWAAHSHTALHRVGPFRGTTAMWSGFKWRGGDSSGYSGFLNAGAKINSVKHRNNVLLAHLCFCPGVKQLSVMMEQIMVALHVRDINRRNRREWEFIFIFKLNF